MKLGYPHTRLAASAERAWIQARFTSAWAAPGSGVHEENGRLVIAPA